MRMMVRQAMSVRDEGRSLAAGLRSQAANHLERLGLRALVVSVKEKARSTCQVRIGKTNASEPLTKCRKRMTDVKTGESSLLRDQRWGYPLTASAASGIKVA